MTKKEIIEYCLKEYKKLLEDIRGKSLFYMKRVAESRGMHVGVCFFMKETKGIHIYGDKWVQKHYRTKGSVLWAPYLYWSQTKEEFINNVQTRINILKSEYGK